MTLKGLGLLCLIFPYVTWRLPHPLGSPALGLVSPANEKPLSHSLPFSPADVQIDHLGLLKQFEHLDPQNQHTFEARDLELLIQAVCGRWWEYRAG